MKSSFRTALLVAAVGGFSACALLEPEPFAEPAHWAPAPWHAHAAPGAPACRSLAVQGVEPRFGVALCHSLMRSAEYPACTENLRDNETTCGTTVVQWEQDGTASVFIGDDYDATISVRFDPNTLKYGKALEIQFDDGTYGSCAHEHHAVTLCIHADPTHRGSL